MNPQEEHIDLVSDPFLESAMVPPTPPGSDSDGNPSGGPAENANELEKLRNELNETKDRLLRSHAELINYQNRVKRQMDEERKYASMGLMRDLLPVGDNILRTLDAVEKTSNLQGLIEGVKLVCDQFYQVLQKNHCERIEALNQPFDPNFHESIALCPSEAPPNTVVEETQAGFRLYDRVVRPSQVVLAAAIPKMGE